MKNSLAVLLILSAGYMLLNFFSIPRETFDVFLNYNFLGAVSAVLVGLMLLLRLPFAKWVALAWALGSIVFFVLDLQGRVLRPYSASMFMGAYWAGKLDVHTYIGVATVYVFNILKFALPLLTLAVARRLK